MRKIKRKDNNTLISKVSLIVGSMAFIGFGLVVLYLISIMRFDYAVANLYALATFSFGSAVGLSLIINGVMNEN
tara:strand:+ start:160 stop:381 length:222 start_codon:yes stop_codon:yes gene_type:complete